MLATAVVLLAALAATCLPACTATVPALKVTPSDVNFGAAFGDITVGATSAPSTVLLNNTGSTPLDVTSLTMTGANSGDFLLSDTTLPLQIAPGESASISVMCKPTEEGARTAALAVESNDPGGVVTVPLTGQGTKSAAPKAQLSPTSLDYGSVVVGQSVSKTFTLLSVGTTTLQTSNIQVTGAQAAAFTSSDADWYTLAPGISVAFTVTFKPTAAGAANAQIEVTSNDPAGRVVLPITGTGTAGAASLPLLQVSPLSVPFGSITIGKASSASTVRLSNTGTAALNLTSLALSGANVGDFILSATTLPLQLAAGASADISVACKPTAAGTRTATLAIGSNSSGGTVTVSLSGQGTAATSAKAQTAPTALDFGSVTVGQSISKSFTLLSVGTQTLQTSSIQVTGAQAAAFSSSDADWYTLPAGISVTFTVTFKPTAAGAANAQIEVVSNDPAGKTVLPLTGSGSGTSAQPLLQASPTSLTFGSTIVGTTSAASTLRLSNSGTAALSVTSLTLAGTNPGDFLLSATTLPLQIAAGASASVSVMCKPTATGTRTATLAIGSNNPGGTVTVPLSGQCTAATSPNLVVSPTSVSFGSTAVGGTSAASTVRLSNTGAAALSVTGLSLAGSNAADFVRSTPTLPLQVAAGSSTSISITFKPTASGTRTASLTVASNNPAGNVTVPLSGSATIPQPLLQISPTSVSFGSVAVGATSAASTLQLSNTGAAALSVTALNLAGANAAEFSQSSPTLPLQIAAGASANISISFKPAASGTRTATLTIASNNPSGNVSVALSGTAPATGGSATHANDGSVLGTNLSPISDWSPEWAFVDCFKTSRDWMSGELWVFQDSRTLTLDANGWPTSLLSGQVARTLLFWEQVNTYPSGDYIVLYDGSGTLAYQGAATKVSGTAGRDVVHVDASQGGWQLLITATTPGNYVRNIRVIMPGGGSAQDPYSWYGDAASCPYGDYKSFEQTYQTQPFHPIFLNSIKNYKVLRFMDWMDTNNSAQTNWTDRPTPADARWSIKGVPVEIMCSLANTIHADPWFNLPHLATDDYLSKFAAVVRDQLAPDIHAYSEYSNEMWNGGFGQAQYAQQQGVALGLNSNAYAAESCYTALRSVQMFSIFEQVLGGTSRIKRVLATQAAGWYLGEVELTYNNAYQHADVLAIAPYFGCEYGSPDNEAATQAMSVDQLFASLNATEMPTIYTCMQANANLATKYGLELVAYEGGQSLIGYYGVENNDTITALFNAANRDPRMGQVYTNYLNTWKSYGGGIFIHYLNCLNNSKWGYWGTLEWLDQDPGTAPKYTALQQFIKNNR